MEFPQDAAMVVERLHEGLRQDAALAVMGIGCKVLPLPHDGLPISTAEMRNGGRIQDEFVQNEAASLLSRFAMISMVSRIDLAAQDLLLQRRILEHVATTGKAIPEIDMWTIIRRVHKEYRVGAVKLCSDLIVEKPSVEVTQRMKWLEGLVAIRNCLTHRLGIIQIEDLKEPGKSIEDIKLTDCLTAIWLRPVMVVDGKEIKLPYFQESSESKIGVRFDEQTRKWRLGEQIVVTPDDCQTISLSLSILANFLLADFHREMNALFLSSPASGLPVGFSGTKVLEFESV